MQKTFFSIGGLQDLPLVLEQWNSTESKYGTVQVKCTNIAGKGGRLMNRSIIGTRN